MMFAEAGRLYVYISYGIHHCINIVTERKDKGCAVLIRNTTANRGVSKKC